jgi:hypothetical protein
VKEKNDPVATRSPIEIIIIKKKHNLVATKSVDLDCEKRFDDH